MHSPSAVTTDLRVSVCSAWSSFTRSLVPMTMQVSRGEAAAISGAFSMASGVSIIAQIWVRSGAPSVAMREATLCTVSALSTLGMRRVRRRRPFPGRLRPIGCRAR